MEGEREGIGAVVCVPVKGKDCMCCKYCDCLSWGM